MEVNFIKISPTQNMTILVTDKIDRKFHKDVAEKLMSFDNVFAEQVGYIEKPKNREASVRLQMMGGEFCGNASLSLGAYITSLKHLNAGSQNVVKLECSGANELLDCVVNVLHNGYRCKIKIPAPEAIEEKGFNLCETEFFGGFVYFQGITHLIIDTTKYEIDKEKFAKAAIEENLFGNVEAFGIMFYDSVEGEIAPFVYVRSTDSKTWERGCGSGSAALGAYLSYKSKSSGMVAVKQPGGDIIVYVIYGNDSVSEVSIEGFVKIVASGVAYI